MKYHIVILSMACLSCLAPPALGHGFIAKAAAIKGAALIAKGAALKGAVLLAKRAALKGAILLAKGSILKGAAVHSASGVPVASPVPVSPVTVAKPVYVVRPLHTGIPPEFPGLLLGRLKGLFGVVHSSIKAKASGAVSLVAALLSAKSRPPVVYEVSQPVYGVPVVDKVVS